MNRAEQIEFVNDLTSAVVKDIVFKIVNGHVPEDWNGIELRQLIADKFADNVAIMDKRRAKDYKNTIATTSI